MASSQQNHAKPPQQTLHANAHHSQETQATEEASGAPQGRGQDQGQHAHRGADHAMTVLVEDASHHLRPRIEEHVVPERCWPVRNSQGSPRVGHEAAQKDEQERGDYGHHGQAVGHRTQWRRPAPARTKGSVWGRKSALDSGALYS